MERKQISLLVILYGKKFSESETLRSIINFNYKIDNLIVVNNGPNAQSIQDEFLESLRLKHHNVIFNEYLENRPLSWIYNDFVKSYNSDYYMIFDDDTSISKDNENSIFNLNNVDIELPKIFAQDKKQYYPIVNGVVYTTCGLIEEYSEIYSIGSGLILSEKVKNIFKKENLELFDSNFALYGVDISFFRKINCLRSRGIVFKVSSSILIDHSLSRIDKKNDNWRENERLYDEILSIKYYKKYKILRILKLCLKMNFDIISIRLILEVYRKGFHPRCIK